ncbi:hypothetical protein EXU85_21155 [Spirosoma sp. KCTC 42546]|uniref:hypothetical protein n=1 Tax=Spirosoma sp. KCTC 42546 TaxID=2520506 RepID=UPI001158B55E|nr:hypothetical protein [Spirosoma sp. KCTC 42546]QDK80986.1 hypothetical protein EXU85_21155 [Spirosoma sp. KCTC 42546]
MNIYVIAGPPGIGKSTSGKNFIPRKTPIIDQDLAGYQYKKQGFSDYRDLASLSTQQKVRDHLFVQKNFALELNLGFSSHYEYLKSISGFDPSNRVHLLLFFTDNLSLCIDRAKIRHLSGGHEVKQEIIEEMYASTLPLFEQHKKLFSSVRLIDVQNTIITEPRQHSENLPAWISTNNLTGYLLN